MEDVPVRVNNPAPATRPVAPAGHGARAPQKPKKNRKWKQIATIIAPLLIVLAFVVGAWFMYQSSTSAHIDKNKYQAVFFTNGQVYFGKLDKLSGGYFKLSDIFYLQANSTDDGESANPQETATQDPSDVQLIKLGSEVHGPEDEMIMSKDQILFFENLKNDGTVTETIKQYQSQQEN